MLIRRNFIRVVFLTLGSRGDVQLYIYLAKELIKTGHESIVCTGATFKKEKSWGAFISSKRKRYSNSISN